MDGGYGGLDNQSMTCGAEMVAIACPPCFPPNYIIFRVSPKLYKLDYD